jgi:hypothetical protein
MKGHARPLGRWFMAVGAIVLIAGHGAILYYISSHIVLSAGVVFGVIVLITAKHLGLLGPLYAVLRGRSPPNAR